HPVTPRGSRTFPRISDLRGLRDDHRLLRVESVLRFALGSHLQVYRPFAVMVRQKRDRDTRNRSTRKPRSIAPDICRRSTFQMENGLPVLSSARPENRREEE